MRPHLMNAPRLKPSPPLPYQGPPGGGKGTISKKILRDFAFSHVSTGDVLRSHVRNETPIGIEAKSYMSAGEVSRP